MVAHLASCLSLTGAAVTPTVPAGYGGEVLPGPFPDTLSAVQFSINAAAVTSVNGTDRGNFTLSICGQGPLPWTATSFQQGSIAARLSAKSNASLALAGSGPSGSNASLADQLTSGQTGWSPNMDYGVLLASVTTNGQNWTSDEAPFYSLVATSVNSSAAGYDMATGLFTPGGVDILSSKAGRSGQTCNTDTGAVWFPFSEGWTAACISGSSNTSAPATYGSPTAFSASLPADASQVFTWTSTGGQLTLPGVHASSSGLLFAISMSDPGRTNGSTSQVSVAPQGTSWTVQIRSDVSLAAGGFAAPEESMFSFVYLPFGFTENLIGGHVDGSSGTTIFGQGASLVEKVDAGVYSIRLMKPRNRNVSCSDGVLLLQTVGLGQDGNTSAASLSYDFQGDGTMLVQARTVAVAADGSLNHTLTDTDYYFAWVDFLQPIHPAGYGAPSIVNQPTTTSSPVAPTLNSAPGPSSPLQESPVVDQPAAAPALPEVPPAPAPSFANIAATVTSLNRTVALMNIAQSAAPVEAGSSSASLSIGSKLALALGVCAGAVVLGVVALVVIRRRRIRYPKISLDLKRMNSLEARRMRGVPLAEMGSGGSRTSATDFNILQV